ncbi:class I SAM-dependent methyltransferase [Noviherbaspirillum sp. L7-7A]|uniref:class I SAM-dependent methyltransferase n=1 Tax=Noviherbaspirillum sp. L7-7A TaxID=2850560 RepID=UPI001C2BBB49|nr:class I SAM-dependent methyltransferase [Noviherbaspirillum sp. L7-7A]MBV0881376.1 class I SAM-dependent methyltransferase [Noviherbaspirillum sp. L7-7A]
MTDARFFQAAATWDQRYSAPEFVFGTEPNAYLADQAGLLQAGKKALAVADGEGRNSVWLARQGLLVDAFDISPVGVDKARRLAREAGADVNYHVNSCDDWAWQAKAYDYVVAIFVQFADPDMRDRLFANMVRSLKPGGCLVLQGYTPRQLEYKTGGPGLLEHLYTEDMLRAAFAGLRIVDMRSYDAQLNEGSRHSGMSALVGMVAQK